MLKMLLDRRHRGKDTLRVIHVHWRVDDVRGHNIHADTLGRIFHRQLCRRRQGSAPGHGCWLSQTQLGIESVSNGVLLVLEVTGAHDFGHIEFVRRFVVENLAEQPFENKLMQLQVAARQQEG
jgi:hypothetical protein